MASAVIVDDDADVRRIVQLRLELAGVEVVAAVGDAVSGLLAWYEHRPDVVVFDDQMPGRSGLDAAEALRRTEPDARIVVFSAALDAASTARVEAAGLTFVRKSRLVDLLDVAAGVAA